MLITKICAAELSKKIVSAAEILKKDPNNEEANYAMAYDHFQNKNYEKAIVHLGNLEDPEPLANSNFLRTNLLIFYCYEQLDRQDLSNKLLKDKGIELDAEILKQLTDKFYFPAYEKFDNAFEETIVKEYLLLKILTITNNSIMTDPFYDTLSEFNIAFGKPAVDRKELLETKESLFENTFVLFLSLCARLEEFTDTNSYSLIIHTINIIYKTLPEEIKEFQNNDNYAIMAKHDYFELLLGNSYLNLNDYDKAREHLINAQKINPKSSEAKNLLSKLLLR